MSGLEDCRNAVVSQKLISGKVGHPKHDCSPCYDDCFSLQVAAFFARNHPAQCSVVLPLLLELPKLGGENG